jgi:hypothetical protein
MHFVKSQNSKGSLDLFRISYDGILFRISNDHDHRDNHDYHSSEILSDNREIAIIALAKKVEIIRNRNYHIHQEAINVFREKMKTPFRINPTQEPKSKE